MQRDYADQCVLMIDDRQELHSGWWSFHLFHCLDCHCVWTNDSWVPVAHLSDGKLEDAFPTCLESTTQVTVCKCADQMIFFVYNKQATASFTR